MGFLIQKISLYLTFSFILVAFRLFLTHILFQDDKISPTCISRISHLRLKYSFDIMMK